MLRHREESHPIVVPMEDAFLHTQAYPFCSTCPCHEDPELLSEVTQAVKQGLLTSDEATQLVKGQTL